MSENEAAGRSYTVWTTRKFNVGTGKTTVHLTSEDGPIPKMPREPTQIFIQPTFGNSPGNITDNYAVILGGMSSAAIDFNVWRCDKPGEDPQVNIAFHILAFH